MDTEELSTEQVLAGLRLHNREPSERQLRRWSHVELIPPSRQSHVRGTAGSTTIWPPGTVTAVLDLMERRTHERRLGELRFQMWWDGRWTSAGARRPAIAGLIDEQFTDIRQLREEHSDPLDAADALVAKAKEHGFRRSAVFRLLRYRMRGDEEDVWSVVHTMFLLALGGEPVWDNRIDDPDIAEPSLRELVERGFGFPRALKDRVYGAQPWLSETPDIAAELTRLRDAGMFDLVDPAQLVLDAGDAQLEQARQDAVVLVDLLGDITQAAENVLGRDFAGLGIIAAARKDGGYGFRAGMVRYCLLLRGVVPEGSIERIAAVAPAAATVSRGIIEIHQAFPRLTRHIKHDVRVRLAALPIEVQQTIHQRVTHFIDRRPELRKALDEANESPTDGAAGK